MYPCAGWGLFIYYHSSLHLSAARFLIGPWRDALRTATFRLHLTLQYYQGWLLTGGDTCWIYWQNEKQTGAFLSSLHVLVCHMADRYNVGLKKWEKFKKESTSNSRLEDGSHRKAGVTNRPQKWQLVQLLCMTRLALWDMWPPAVIAGWHRLTCSAPCSCSACVWSHCSITVCRLVVQLMAHLTLCIISSFPKCFSWNRS